MNLSYSHVNSESTASNQKLRSRKHRQQNMGKNSISVVPVAQVFSTSSLTVPHPCPSSTLASPKAVKEQMIKVPLILSGLCSDIKGFFLFFVLNGFYFRDVIIFPFCSFSNFFLHACVRRRGRTEGGKSTKCLPSGIYRMVRVETKTGC